MAITTILIDLDDTLCNSRGVYQTAYEQCRILLNSKTGMSLTKKDFYQRFMSARKLIKDMKSDGVKTHSRTMYFQYLLEGLNIPYDAELNYELVTTYYDSVKENIELYPGAMKLLEWFKKQSLKIVIVSDGSTRFRIVKIHGLGLSSYIDYLVSSEEVGITKPNKKVFEKALEKAGSSIEASIMIGNSAKKDIKGAKALGIKTIKVSVVDHEDDQANSEEESADYEVISLSKIPTIINQLTLDT